VPSKDVKTLIVKLNGEKELRVKCPAISKVTFGPAIPAPTRGNFDGQREYALRIYDGATEKSGLLAVFTNVREFRVAEIEVDKLVIREAGKTIWQSDEKGLELTHSIKRDRKLIRDRVDDD